MSPIFEIVAGLLLIVAGRRLFWVFIAIIGFLVGVDVARELFAGGTEWAVWVGGIAAGAVGAVAAMFFQRVAFALAGFYAGGYLAMLIAQSLGWPAPHFAVILVGGVVGAVVAALAMDWAIIVLSTLVGVGMIVGTLDLVPLHRAIVASVLVVVGILVQSSTARKRRERPEGR